VNKCIRPCVAAALLVLLGCGAREESGLPEVREHGAAPEEAAIVIEAENFTGELEPPMKLTENLDASHGKCIAIEGGSGKPGAKNPVDGAVYPDRWGAAVYKFNVQKSGQYRFWGRKFWEGGCGNSFTLLVNSLAPVEFGGDGVYDAWDWKPCTVLFELRAGENRLEVLNREDGVKLDKILLTTDLEFVPQGKE
jgi:hypothetical protein